MANTLTEVTPQLLAAGLATLREKAFLPLIVNRRYDDMAGEQGSTIDVPIPSAITAGPVNPAAAYPSTADIAPTKVQIPLTNWNEAAFYLTDKDLMEIQNGTIPGQVNEAAKSLANLINDDIFALYKDLYGYTGVAGTTPFAASNGTADVTNARKLLENQLADDDPRYLVLDTDAEAAALNLRAFQDASFSTDGNVILEGQLGRKLGFNFMSHQRVPTHTAGTAAAATVTCTDANAAGDSTVTLAVSSSTATLLKGDVLTFDGHAQTYVVTSTGPTTLTTGGVAVSVAPDLQVAVDGSGTPVNVDVKSSHVVNLAMHRDAFAFAMRPLARSSHPSSIIDTMVDEESGLVLRMEVTREYKRDRYSFDALYGVATLRREFGARLAG